MLQATPPPCQFLLKKKDFYNFQFKFLDQGH